MKILVVAGDKRQEYLCEKLNESEIECEWIKDTDYDLIRGKINNCSVVVLPVPFSKDGVTIFCSMSNSVCKIDDFIDLLNDNQHVIGFGTSSVYTKKLSERNIKYIDLMKDKNFVEYNSLMTAQGALRLMLENTQQCILGKKVLVTGFGYVSKELCRVLYNLGLDITVCARNKMALKLAHSFGYGSIDFYQLKNIIHKFDYIFGTVPFNVVNEDSITNINRNAVYYELASAPYGADKALFEKHNKKYILAAGLPGKYCPKSWADAVTGYCISELIYKEEH